MLLERVSANVPLIVAPGVRVQTFVGKKGEQPTAKFSRSGTSTNIDPAAGGTTVLRGELIRNYLDLVDVLNGGLETYPADTVIIIIEPIDRDVVRIRSSAGQRKNSTFDQSAAWR